MDKLLLACLLVSFQISFSQWTQKGSSIMGNLTTFQNIGNVGFLDMSKSGNRLVTASTNINYPLKVKAFEFVNNDWVQLGGDIDGVNASTSGNASVAMSSDGSVIVVSDPDFNNHGIVQVHKYVSGVWTQLGTDLLGTAVTDMYFGDRVTINSDGSIIGIYSKHYNGQGHVKLYENINNTWTQIGQEITENSDNGFGRKLMLDDSGNRLVTLQIGDNDGLVRVYDYNLSLNSWEQVANAISVGNNGGDVNITSDGSKIIFGRGYDFTVGDRRGLVRVFEYDNGTWQQEGATIYGEADLDFLGSSVNITDDGNMLVVSAHQAHTVNGDHTGQIRFFKKDNGNWSELNWARITGINEFERLGISLKINADGSIISAGSNIVDPGSIDMIRAYENRSLNIAEKQDFTTITLYPNPVNDRINIDLKKIQNASVKMFDMYGRLLFEAYNVSNEVFSKSIDLIPGHYVVEIRNKDISRYMKFNKL